MSEKKSAPPGPLVSPQDRPGPSGVRLNKRMAELGLCSRRQADEWIERGWVRVDGRPAQLGLLVGADSRIDIDARAREKQSREVTVLLNKPVGYVSAQAEDGHLPAVSLFKADRRWGACTASLRWSPHQLRGLAPAGRLDIDSVGLLVLTQDGRLARQLIGEDSEVDKEYLVRVSYEGLHQNVQAVFPSHQLERLRHGLSLDGQALKAAEVSWQNPEQLRFVLREGRKRQIRRMCELVGLKVTGLKRIRIGRVLLGTLPLGQWRYLRDDESF